MFKTIDIWKKLNDTSAVRYRCFQRLMDGMFCIQSADYYHLPLRDEQIRALDRQFVELFIEDSPDQRSPLYPTLEAAIAQYEQDFLEEDISSSLESQVA